MRATPARLAAPATAAAARLSARAEVRLPDAVHQVVEDIDGPGHRERAVRRIRVGGVEHHRRDAVEPAVSAQFRGITRGDHDVVAVAEQSGDKPGTRHNRWPR